MPDLSSKFNLFDTEDKALAQAEQLSAQLTEVPPAIRDGVESLVESYRSVLREQRRLVRLSDRQQSQVATLNKELAQRTEQAEAAVQQLKAAQDQLVQAEKLASLGALVGGVAHEINTPVGVALSCASLLTEASQRLQKLYQADDVGVDDFEDFLAQTLKASALVVDNCQRAAELIGSFKQVAVDRISSERRTFDLGRKITATVTSLGPQIRTPGHQILLDCPAGVMVDGYPGILSQIITNLVMNAILHGFGDRRGGHIKIKVEPDGQGWVGLIFADDGKGIAPQHLDRIFDPFFTTKMGQGGSGLGLNIVYNLVVGTMGGTIVCRSEPGMGAEFHVRFPLVAPS